MSGYNTLYEDAVSATSLLRNAEKAVEELARYDAKFQDSSAQLQSARATVEDIAATLRDYAEGINASPERLAEIEDRLALLDKLKRKYGQPSPRSSRSAKTPRANSTKSKIATKSSSNSTKN